MTYFFDRNVGNKVPMALELLGLDVQYYAKVFGERTERGDDDWLAACGQRGWTVIAHDTRFRHNEPERQAIVRHRVGCFVLGEAQAPRWAKVRLLARAWDHVEQLRLEEPLPFIFRIRRDGTVGRVYPPLLPVSSFTRSQ